MIKASNRKQWKFIISLFLSISLLLLLLLGGFLYSRPWDQALFITPITHVDQDKKVIALTFDDGPSEIATPALLDLLQKHDVKATFFMLGSKIEERPDIAQRAFDEGHLIGNHSYDHPRFLLRSPGFVRDQIERTDQHIQDLGQEEVKYFRPPYSFSYIVLPLVLNDMGKEMVNGSYDPPAEYILPIDGEKIANQVIENFHPGMILYLHDIRDNDAEEFVKGVDLIITAGKSEGYSFVLLD